MFFKLSILLGAPFLNNHDLKIIVVMFVSELSLLACSAPWLSGVVSELKPGFPLIVFSRIRRRVHDNLIH